MPGSTIDFEVSKDIVLRIVGVTDLCDQNARNLPNRKKPPLKIGPVRYRPYFWPTCRKKRSVFQQYATVGMEVLVCTDRRRHGPPLLGQLGTTGISISSCTRQKKRPRSLEVAILMS